LGAATIDPLESTFAAAEKRAALEAELDELLRDPSRAAS
jgi:hypothetical protein